MGQNYYGPQSQQAGQSFAQPTTSPVQLSAQQPAGYNPNQQFTQATAYSPYSQSYGQDTQLMQQSGGMANTMQNLFPQMQGQSMPQIPPQLLMALLAQKMGGQGLPQQLGGLAGALQSQIGQGGGMGGLVGSLQGLLGQMGQGGVMPQGGPLGGIPATMAQQLNAAAPQQVPQPAAPIFAPGSADEAGYLQHMRDQVARNEAQRTQGNAAAWAPLFGGMQNMPTAQNALSGLGSGFGGLAGKGGAGGQAPTPTPTPLRSSPRLSPQSGPSFPTAPNLPPELAAPTGGPTGDPMNQILPPQAPGATQSAQQGWPGLAMIMQQLGIRG